MKTPDSVLVARRMKAAIDADSKHSIGHIVDIGDHEYFQKASGVIHRSNLSNAINSRTGRRPSETEAAGIKDLKEMGGVAGWLGVMQDTVGKMRTYGQGKTISNVAPEYAHLAPGVSISAPVKSPKSGGSSRVSNEPRKPNGEWTK